MAKQLVNPFERHVEKAVLGLAGLALVASIATYVVRTPNRTELGGETVTPGSVDEKIAQKASDAIKRMQNAKAEPQIPEPLAAKFEESLKPIKAPALPLAAALRPDVPMVDAGIIGGPAGLVKVNKPAKPVFTKGRGTFVMQDAAGNRLVPSDWVSVSALWNVKEQREAQMRDYGSAHSEIVLASPQLQRRMQRPDGTWSEGDWQDVDCSPAAKLPREPVIRLVADGKKITVDRDTLKDIDRFRADLLQSGMQLDLIRPMPPEMAKPTHWVLPIITKYRDVLLQDDEYLYPAEAPAVEPVDRFGVGGEGGAKAVKRVLTPAEEQSKKLEDARVLLDSAIKNLVKSDATRAYNWALEVSVAPATTPADKDKAKRLQKEAEQAEKQIVRETALGTQPKPGGGPATAQGDKPKREKLPTQQVWAHDATIGNLVSGATYQYRMRFRMLNVLAGAPNKFEKPENAAVVLVAGEWSDPTDPVTIEPSVEYYVTGEDPKDKEISVDYFRWYLGVWVKPERRMKCGIGQTLSDRQRIKVPGIDDPNAVETAEVEFTADAVVIDVDLDRPIRERKAGSTPKGVRFGAPANGTAAVLVDSQGHLTERFVLVDKNHPGKKEATNRLWAPKK